MRILSVNQTMNDIPVFCQGGMYALNKSTMHGLYCLAQITNPFESIAWEDAYITGDSV